MAQGAVFSGLGRITDMTSADGTSDYTYDATSQLTGADHSYQTDETYTYDSNGNRTMDGYDTGPNNQLLDNGTYAYEYDDEGNRTRRVKTSDDSSTEYEWDFRNRLIRVTDKDAEDNVTQVVEYKYDVFDRRISRAVDTTDPFDLDDAAIELYVLDDLNGVTSPDGGNVIIDFVDPDGPEGEVEITLAKRYLYGNEVDQLLAQEDVTESSYAVDRVLWSLVDHLQTVRDLYANDATNAEHYQYDSFGKLTDGSTSITRYLYTSRELDPAVGLQYNRARWYDGGTSQWLAIDPVVFQSRDSELYRYSGNNSTNSIDPTGLAPPTNADEQKKAYEDWMKAYSLEKWVKQTKIPPENKATKAVILQSNTIFITPGHGSQEYEHIIQSAELTTNVAGCFIGCKAAYSNMKLGPLLLPGVKGTTENITKGGPNAKVLNDKTTQEYWMNQALMQAKYMAGKWLNKNNKNAPDYVTIIVAPPLGAAGAGQSDPIAYFVTNLNVWETVWSSNTSSTGKKK